MDIVTLNEVLQSNSHIPIRIQVHIRHHMAGRIAETHSDGLKSRTPIFPYARGTDYYVYIHTI